MEEDSLFFNDCWNLFFHDPDDSQWTLNSYKNQTTISSALDWVQVYQAYNELWSKGMFFLMREHIQPLWEDPANKDGGCFSFKVNKPEAAQYWFKLGSRVLSDTLVKDFSKFDRVSGISISPKRNYCILRIWVSTNEYNKIEYYNLDLPSYTQVMYKSHIDNNDFDA
jgi:hypothetical protein